MKGEGDYVRATAVAHAFAVRVEKLSVATERARQRACAGATAVVTLCVACNALVVPRLRRVPINIIKVRIGLTVIIIRIKGLST